MPVIPPSFKQKKNQVAAMTRNFFARVALAAVLAVALSTAEVSGAGAPGVCTDDKAVCKPGYIFNANNEIVDVDVLKCSTFNPACVTGEGHQECCSEMTCADIECPYGYKRVANPQTLNTLRVDVCCEADTTAVAAFPVCWDAKSAGVDGTTKAMQALEAGDTNWGIHDNAGFTRVLNQFTGMCFSITILNDCTSADPLVKDKCCSKKVPAYFQFKIPTPLGAPDQDRVDTLAPTKLPRCKISYGHELSNARTLKRVTKWTPVVDTSAQAQYVNVPLTFKKGQRQLTVCMYSLNAAPGGLDCSWENICGLSGDTPPVPDTNGSYKTGCELRIVGRKTAASSLCCAPTFSVEAFDSSAENRLSNGAPVSEVIELRV
jgi:hypothetical protein